MTPKSALDNSFVEKIKSNSNIVDVISRYVPLSKKGKTFWGCCPFHLEKTPSFAVNFEDQFYHCFGCGESGDVIKFIQKHENCDFIKALEILAKNAGIEMPTIIFDENILKLKKQKETIYKINKEAAIYYNKNLFSEKGRAALDYLFARGLSQKTIIKFGLGVSLGWNEVVDFLVSKGFSKSEILLSGIADEKNGRIFDAFAGRVIFPLINTFNDVVGFSGRTMKNDAEISKYKNTKETLVFDKSRCVFNLNLVKKKKQEEGLENIIIAEGQMDVIKLYDAGFKNAVASLGTAFTKFHAKEIKRFCDKVVVCFDGDEAGQKAALKSIDVLEAEGLQVSVVSLPGGLDPDDFISRRGKTEFEKLLKNGDSPTDYKLKTLYKKFDISKNAEKSAYIKEAITVLKTKGSEIDADIYLTTVSKLTGVHIDTLRRELSLDKAAVQTRLETKEPKKEDAFVRACKFCLAALLAKKSYATKVENEFFKFGDSTLQKIYEFALCKKQISLIFDEFNLEESPQINDILNEQFSFENEEDEEKFYKDSVNEILIKNMLLKKEKLLSEFKKTKNPALLNELKELDDKILKTKQEIRND